MDRSEVQGVLSRIKQQLSGLGGLEPVVELAIEELLNVVEALSSDKQSLFDEVQRLKQQIAQKKKAKTTGNNDRSEKKSGSSV